MSIFDNDAAGVQHGNFDRSDVNLLMKAMNADHVTGRETNDLLTNGSALKVESLENVMKVLTAQQKHIPFFSRISKKPATNTVEEYNQLVSYGNFDGGFTSEGELPESSDSQYRRRSQMVKYIGVTGGVTHQMQLVNTSGVPNMIAGETKNKSMLIMQMMEKYLPFADERVVPEQFNGFFAQHEQDSGYGNYAEYMDSEHVVDCNGKILTDTKVENASLVAVNNFGMSDVLLGPPEVFSNFNSRYHDKKLIHPVSAMVKDGVFGQRVNTIITQNGEVEILQSNFFKNRDQKNASTGATSTKAPAAPVSITATSVGDTMSKATINGVGDYFYAITAKNKYGESAMTFKTGLTTVAAGQSVDIQITPGAGTYPATGYAVYKSEVDPANPQATVVMHKIFEIGVQQLAAGYDGASAGSIRDRFRFIPNTDQAWLVEWDAEQIFAFKQLAPLMKMNLAITGPISRFMVLLYGTPILYAPRKTIRFVNIGKQL